VVVLVVSLIVYLIAEPVQKTGSDNAISTFIQTNDADLPVFIEFQTGFADSVMDDVPSRNRLYRLLDLYDADLLKLSGRLYLDAGLQSMKDKRDFVPGSQQDSQIDLDFGFRVRSARIRAEGAIHPTLRWRAEMEVISNTFTARGIMLQYTHSPRFQLIFGNLAKEPMGIERMSPLGWYSFMELPVSVATFMPERSASFRAEYRGDTYNLMLSALRSGDRLLGEVDEGGYNVAGRVTWSPYHDANRFFHVGLSGAYRINTFDRPDTHATVRRYTKVSYPVLAGNRAVGSALMGITPIDDVFDVTRYNADWAFGMGQLYAQGEFTGMRLRRDFALQNMYFGGYYAQAGYFLTRDRRPYLPKEGRFGPLTPRQSFTPGGGIGAVELAVRYSFLDMREVDYDGGTIHQIALALNWFLNRDTSVTLNYIFVGTNLPDGNGSRGGVACARMQFEF
jgi:phosphate-selective porin OprO and OprP